MDETLRALGGILLRAIPTFVLVVLLHFYLKFIFFKPLQKVLRQRYEATQGARKLAESSLAKAAEKAAEYEAALRAALFENVGIEGAAYVLFREAQIASDPWDRRRHTKLLVREVNPILPVSADGMHVTWDTASYVALLQRAQREEMVLGIAHSHPTGPAGFSGQDDANEAELLRTACNRNGTTAKLVSLLFTGDGTVLARVWQYPKHQTAVRSVMFIGERIQFHRPGAAPASAAFARQILAFGPALIHQLKNLRVGIIGAGGTGSATAPLLARAAGSIAYCPPMPR